MTTAAHMEEALSPMLLHLILLPTEACNFRCTYCYEDFKLGRMGEDVVRGIEILLSRRVPKLRRLDLSWFGGEPLMARDIMLRILDHVARLRQEHPELQFNSDATTNGILLTPELLERFQSLGLTRFQISFDGPPRHHDRKRVKVGGAGTFDRIWANLLAIRDLDLACTITIRLHVDQENAGSCPEFLRRFRREFGGDARFPLFLRLLSRWGGPNDATLPVYAAGDGEEALARLRSLAEELEIPLHRSGSEDRICYAARGNSFLIRADGRVNKCTLALNAAANQVGRLTGDGKLLIDAQRAGPWMRGLWTNSAEALECPKEGLVSPDPIGMVETR